MHHYVVPTSVIDATLYILLAFSVVTWALIFFKVWQFTRNSFANNRFNTTFWDLPDLNAVEKLPDDMFKGPIAHITQQGIAWLHQNRASAGKHLKFLGTPRDLLEQSLVTQMHKEQRKIESGITMLASIGSTAPFVGLFGTVLGIMHAMQEITQSGSTSLDVVAGPIGDALVATAVGIAVAVPAVLAYNFLLRRAKQQRQGLENFIAGFMHIAFCSGLVSKE